MNAIATFPIEALRMDELNPGTHKN